MEGVKKRPLVLLHDSCPHSHTRAGELDSALAAMEKGKTTYPHIMSEDEWLANEELLLYDAEVGNQPVRQFKCRSCYCVNSYLADHPRSEEIMSTGRRMHHRPNCVNRGCFCHTALGTPTEIATRLVDWGDVPF